MSLRVEKDEDVGGWKDLLETENGKGAFIPDLAAVFEMSDRGYLRVSVANEIERIWLEIWDFVDLI